MIFKTTTKIKKTINADNKFNPQIKSFPISISNKQDTVFSTQRDAVLGFSRNPFFIYHPVTFGLIAFYLDCRTAGKERAKSGMF